MHSHTIYSLMLSLISPILSSIGSEHITHYSTAVPYSFSHISCMEFLNILDSGLERRPKNDPDMDQEEWNINENCSTNRVGTSVNVFLEEFNLNVQTYISRSMLFSFQRFCTELWLSKEYMSLSQVWAGAWCSDSGRVHTKLSAPSCNEEAKLFHRFRHEMVRATFIPQVLLHVLCHS